MDISIVNRGSWQSQGKIYILWSKDGLEIFSLLIFNCLKISVSEVFVNLKTLQRMLKNWTTFRLSLSLDALQSNALKRPQGLKTRFFHWLWMIIENEWCYFYLQMEIREQIFAWPVLALPLFCLYFSGLRHVPKSWFLILWTEAQASLLLLYIFVRWWVGR